MNRVIALLAWASVMLWAGVAAAQVAQVCYYEPTTVYYQPAPAYYTSYYAPAPVTTYYAPAPTTACYAPAPTTVYYAAAPAPVVVAPGPVVTTRYRPILGGTVTRVHYPWYGSAYPAIAYYRY